MAPRTVCACHPVSAIICAMEAPELVPSKSISWACLLCASGAEVAEAGDASQPWCRVAFAVRLSAADADVLHGWDAGGDALREVVAFFTEARGLGRLRDWGEIAKAAARTVVWGLGSIFDLGLGLGLAFERMLDGDELDDGRFMESSGADAALGQ